MSQPESLFRVVRRFSVGELVTLFKIDLTKQGGGMFYFTNNVFEDRIPVHFDLNNYVHIPVSMDNVDIDSQGSPAQPRFQIATAGGPVAALLAQYKDLKGAKVWRIKTFAEFLDFRPNGSGGIEVNPSADPAAQHSVELFVIDRKVGANDVYAEFDLVSPTDQEGIMLPLRIVRKRWCDAEYRIYAPDSPDAAADGFIYFEHVDGGCPWTGTTYFDENDQPVMTKAQDRCSKLMTGCLCRYGKTVALPFSACPGVRAAAEAG